MMKSRYFHTRIVRILNNVCREYGISDSIYYNWNPKYGGVDASDIKRLEELKCEND